MKHPAWPLLGAAVAITGSGAVFAIVEHIPVTSGLYWALGMATTDGGNPPRTHAGRAVAVAVMLTAIPLLAWAWAWLNARHVHARIRPHLERASDDAAAARRIVAALHRHVTGEDHPDAPE